jgi:hypothetical protein
MPKMKDLMSSMITLMCDNIVPQLVFRRRWATSRGEEREERGKGER